MRSSSLLYAMLAASASLVAAHPQVTPNAMESLPVDPYEGSWIASVPRLSSEATPGTSNFQKDPISFITRYEKLTETTYSLNLSSIDYALEINPSRIQGTDFYELRSAQNFQDGFLVVQESDGQPRYRAFLFTTDPAALEKSTGRKVWSKNFKIKEGNLEVDLPGIWADRMNVGLSLVDATKSAGIQPAIPMFRPIKVKLEKPY